MAGIELATPGSAVRLASVARYVIDCATWPGSPFCGTLANSVEPDQTPQNAVSDQVFHCLLTECPIKMLLIITNTIQQP